MADPVNAQFLVDRLMQGGLSRAQASALVGNFRQESSLNPAAHNRNENAFGLMQWRGDRLLGLQRFASEKGKAWTDPGVQADYALHEMNTTEADNSKNFLSATTVNEANKALHPVIRYKNPAEMGLRASYGQQINDADPYVNREGPQAAATTQAPNVSRETSQQPNRAPYVDPFGFQEQFKLDQQPPQSKGIRGGLTALGYGMAQGAKPVIQKAGGLGSIFGMGANAQPGAQPGTPAALSGFTGLFGKQAGQPAPGPAALGPANAQPQPMQPPAPYQEAGQPQMDEFALQTGDFGALV